MLETTKKLLQTYNIIDNHNKVLPFNRKKCYIFFNGLDSNALFREFYYEYPQDAIKMLPSILAFGLHTKDKAFKSFILSILDFIDISQLNYTFSDLDSIDKNMLKETVISNIFYHNNTPIPKVNI